MKDLIKKNEGLDTCFNRMFDDMWFGLKPLIPDFRGLMKMDIVEKDDRHEIAVELPGYAKDEIKLSLDDGILTIEAEKQEDKEEKDDKGTVIHSERYMGHCSRQINVGDHITEDDIHASFENGVLLLKIMKKEEPKPERKLIAIE